MSIDGPFIQHFKQNSSNGSFFVLDWIVPARDQVLDVDQIDKRQQVRVLPLGMIDLYDFTIAISAMLRSLIPLQNIAFIGDDHFALHLDGITSTNSNWRFGRVQC